MSRKPALKPSDGNYLELLERRLAALESRTRGIPARDVRGGTSATSQVIQQTTHGLAVGNVIRHNGTSWTKSQADTAANAVVGGIVIAVLSPDVFVMATGGYVAGLSGLTAGSVHYLDAATAGALTTTAPTIAVSIILADSATSGVLSALSGGLGEGAACTVLGRAANSAGVRADIAAASDNQVLRRIAGELKFATVVGWGDIQFTSPTHPLPNGYLASPTTLDADGYGSTLGFYADAGSGMDISVVRNSRGDIPGVHNPDDLEIAIKLQNGTAANQVMTWSGTGWAPAALPAIPVSYSMSGDVSGSTSASTVDKLKGKTLADAVGTVSGSSRPSLFMWWDVDNLKWSPFDVWNASAVTGWVNCYDSTAGNSNANSRGVMAGTARSVFGNATAADGLPAGIQSPASKSSVLSSDGSTLSWADTASDDTLLGRRAGALTFAKVARAELADGSALSVIGRSANSTGVPADIVAGSDNFVLGRRAGVLTWAKVARAELADGAACSVVGRAANSSGADADIALADDFSVLARVAGSLAGSKFNGNWGSFVRNDASGGDQSLSGSGFYSGSGTFTVPAGVTKVLAIALGGGGAGGGTDNVVATINGTLTAKSWGGQGGAGARSARWIRVTPGDAITYSVGAAGAASVAADGGDGGDTVITHIASSFVVTGKGGGGGKKGTNTATSAAPGVGGQGGADAGGLFDAPGHNGATGGLSLIGTNSAGTIGSSATAPKPYAASGNNSYGYGGLAVSGGQYDGGAGYALFLYST